MGPTLVPSADRDELICRHLGSVKPLAVAIHQQFPRITLIEDLTQIGALALIEAAGRDNGRNFAAYASACMKGAMLNSIEIRPEQVINEEPRAPGSTAASYELEEALASLPEMEREVLKRRFEGYTREELASSIQMSVREIQTIENRAVARLRRREAPRRAMGMAA